MATKVTRIKASDHKDDEKPTDEPDIIRKKVVTKDKKPKKLKQKPAEKTKKVEKTEKGKKPFILFRPFVAIGHYLRDSWHELRQVRWPNRKATWKMVLAVFIYTAIFAVFLLLLDMLFSFIFNKILG